MTRIRLWLTPATVVIALALAAAIAGLSWRGIGVIRERLTAPASASASPQPTYTVPGTIRLPAGQYAAQGKTCHGTTTGPDAQVVVTDTTGASIAYAPVGAGVLASDGHCDLPFTLTVPAGKGTYAVDVPQIGALTYSEPDLAGLLELIIG